MCKEAQEELRYIETHTDTIINGIKIKAGTVLPILVKSTNEFKGEISAKSSEVVAGMLYELKKNRKCEKSDFYKKVLLADKNLLQNFHNASIVKAKSGTSDDAKLNIDILTSILVLDDSEESYINLIRGIINAIHIEENDGEDENILDEYEDLLINVLYEGLEKYPTSYSILFHLSDYYRINENYESALEYLEKLKENHSGEEVEKLEKSIIKAQKHQEDILYIYDLINMEKPDEALDKCNEVLSNDPKNWYALMLRAWAHRIKGEWQGAIDSALDSIKHGGDDFAENYNEMALSLFALGKKSEALYYQEIAFDMEKTVDYATNLAIIAIDLKEYKKAFNALFEGYRINKEDNILLSLIELYEKESGEKFVYPDMVNENISKMAKHNHKDDHEHSHNEDGCSCHEHSKEYKD